MHRPVGPAPDDQLASEVFFEQPYLVHELAASDAERLPGGTQRRVVGE